MREAGGKWTRTRKKMHHGTGYGTGPQERVHQVPRTATGTLESTKCPYETYQAQIPDCCAAAAAVQDPYPRPPSGYDGRCYNDCPGVRASYQDESYTQVSLLTNILTTT